MHAITAAHDSSSQGTLLCQCIGAERMTLLQDRHRNMGMASSRPNEVESPFALIMQRAILRNAFTSVRQLER